MVNTKVIRQPSQSPSLLSSPLPLSPPPSFLSLLSLSSSHYPKFSNSLSFSFFPFSNPSSSTACLSTRTRHPPHSFYFYSPHPNSQFPIRHSLSASLSLFLYSLCSILGLLFSREVFDCFCCCSGFGWCTDWVRFAKGFWLRWSTLLALYFSYFMFR